jgi:mono/diheme cytochrome c family protein
LPDFAKAVSGAICGVAMIAASSQALGQGGDARVGRDTEAANGRTLYDDKCGVCHGPGGMGTALLGRTRPIAMLEARADLKVPLVVLAARRGIGNMPALPRGELSDAQLQLIADYLAAGPHEVAR